MLSANLRGEMCGGKSEQPTKLAEWDLVDAVARTLHVTSPQELNVLGGVLFPAMLNNAIIQADLSKLDELKGFVSVNRSRFETFTRSYRVSFRNEFTTNSQSISN